jgi:hypothetical protein
VICSIALARLRTDIKGESAGSANAVGMAQKLLLFWRKPARRCWWEGVELDNVEGVEGKLKVWIRRVWTLEMVSSRAEISQRHPVPLQNDTSADFGDLERNWASLIVVAWLVGFLDQAVHRASRCASVTEVTIPLPSGWRGWRITIFVLLEIWSLTSKIRWTCS